MSASRRPGGRVPAAEPFWRRKTLAEMSGAEWESLCDGCGKCCLLKVEYEDTGEVFPTSLSCRLLDRDTCRCSDYADRKRHVPDCILLTPGMVGDLSWLPSTCAYRVLSEGGDLAWWHPLVSGDPETVHAAGISVRQRTISEDEVDGDLQDWIVDWKL
ncbi:MAG: YcgN family cysteine cluster protein [Alphaproteobacteria bacterium]